MSPFVFLNIVVRRVGLGLQVRFSPCLFLSILYHLLFFNNLIKTNKKNLLIKYYRTKVRVGKSEASPLGLDLKWGQVQLKLKEKELVAEMGFCRDFASKNVCFEVAC